MVKTAVTTYVGRRINGETLVTADGRVLPLYLDVHSHSPTGFEWGYAGAGPAQLALALLVDHFQDNAAAMRWHQPFKWAVVTQLRGNLWTITSADIDAALATIENYSRPVPLIHDEHNT